MSASTIAACVFLDFDPVTGTLQVKNKRPYFYHNLILATRDDIAVVHNGSDFGIVKVIDLIPNTNDNAVIKTSKPLLGLFIYNQDAYQSGKHHIAKLREQAEHLEVTELIRKELETRRRKPKGPNIFGTPDEEDD